MCVYPWLSYDTQSLLGFFSDKSLFHIGPTAPCRRCWIMGAVLTVFWVYHLSLFPVPLSLRNRAVFETGHVLHPVELTLSSEVVENNNPYPVCQSNLALFA